MTHPLYGDEDLVHRVTQRHIDAGRTIFQLWLSADSEQKHAINMLDMVRPPHRARVLSLGCGVGGMERYWHEVRPDMVFTLQNISQSQLDLCMCPGYKVLGDAQAYTLPLGAHKHDVTILAYVLGHCDVPRTLEHAIAATCGTILVLDVCDVPDTFTRSLHYEPPSPWQMIKHGFRRQHRTGWQRARMDKVDGTEEQRDAVARSTPIIWTRHG